MLKKLSKLNDKLMKSDDFDNQTERIRNFYFTGGAEPLSEEDEEVRKKAEVIFDMLPTCTTTELRNFLVKKFDFSTSHSYYLIRQAKEIFGVANQVDKEGMRAINTMRYEALLQSTKDEFVKLKCIERIDKINHLEDKSTPSINIEKLLFIPQAEISTDPSVLDIQYEEDN